METTNWLLRLAPRFASLAALIAPPRAAVAQYLPEGVTTGSAISTTDTASVSAQDLQKFPLNLRSNAQGQGHSDLGTER